MEQNRVEGTVEWFDEEKGYGIGRDNDNTTLFIRKSYFANCDNIDANDDFVCTVVKQGKVNHATQLEKVLTKESDGLTR